MTVLATDRYPGLKQILFDFVDQIAKIQQLNPNLADQQCLFFTYLTFPWLAPRDALTDEQRAYQESRKTEISQLGFDAERAKAALAGVYKI